MRIRIDMMVCCKVALCFLAIQSLSTRPLRGADTIVTLAGGGSSLADGPALGASLAHPGGISLDAAGNIYIADTNNERICKLDAAGNLTVIAGNGFADFSGDGGPAKDAGFSDPSGLAVDSAGNIYIADQYNQRIRKIDPAGMISTVAGGGNEFRQGKGEAATSVFLGRTFDVVCNAAGDVFFSEPDNAQVFRIDAAAQTLHLVAGNGSFDFTGDGGPATQATFSQPLSLAIDLQGNLFIADGNGDRVRRVDAATGIITTVAGSGSEEFNGDGIAATSAAIDFPSSIAVDSGGNLFIMDGNHARIRRVDAATQMISTIAGIGLEGFHGDGCDALKAALLFPASMKFDAAGNLVVADSFNNRIRRIGPAPAPGNPYDSDCDGFPNHIEAVALTNPDDAASTPFSNLPVSTFGAIDLKKLSGQIFFTVAGKDKIQLSGILYVPDGTSVSGQQVILDVAGVATAFSLDAKGKSTPKGDNSFKGGPSIKDGQFKFSASLNKGNFAAALANYNLVNANRKNQFLTLPLTIYFNNAVHVEAGFCLYNAKQGKSGKVSTSGRLELPGADLLRGR